MRKINKLTPLPNFNGSNYNNDCTLWTCKNCNQITFHNKYKEIYEETRWQILNEEQNQLCGYTEIYINKLEDCHIDHYIKREFVSRLTFDWDNLIVATKDSDFGANYKDNTYNIQQTEYSQIYNPVLDNIKFQYDEFGAIIEEEGKIKKTVEVFNLNCKSLKKRRADIISIIRSLKNDGNANEDIKVSLKDVGFLSVVEQELY